MKRVRYIAIFTLAFCLFLLLFSGPAKADHGVVRCGGTGERACILTFSPFVERIIKAQGEITYCFNQRASNYPGFRQQVRTVTERQAAQLQVTSREVAYPPSQSDQSCTVRHDMPETHGCGGCGAWIYLGSYPMVIEYRWQVGYTRWDSTIGHEQGHGFCLIDEHYWKQGFKSFILEFGYWIHGAPSVMDSGTWALPEFAPLGIWYFTDYDLDRCEETIGRDLDGSVCPLGPIDPSWGGVWDNCAGLWLGPDSFPWNYSPSKNEWFDRDGVSEWCCQQPYGGIYNRRLEVWRWEIPTVWHWKAETGWLCAERCP